MIIRSGEVIVPSREFVINGGTFYRSTIDNHDYMVDNRDPSHAGRIVGHDCSSAGYIVRIESDPAILQKLTQRHTHLTQGVAA